MKNKSVDALRGIAALNVATAHFVAAFLPMMLYKNYPATFTENLSPSFLFQLLTSPVISIFYNGHFAVLIFFVLSGYVLTLPYYSAGSDLKIILKKRLWGRYLRLNIPIAVAILISYLFLKMGLYFNTEAAEISGSVNWLKNYFSGDIAALNVIKEAVYGSIFFGEGKLVPPLWTLKIEFIGSIYILLFYISKPKGAIVTPMLMAFCLIYAVNPQDSIYYFSIFLGSLLTFFKEFSKCRCIFFILGYYFGGFQFNSVYYDFLPNFNFPVGAAWDRKTFYNVFGAILITLSVIQGFGAKLFESRMVQLLGRFSFSIYLIHFIVLCSLSSFFYIHLPQTKLFLLVNFALYFFACFTCSIIFEKMIDKNSIRISHNFCAKIFAS
jgi:peptidoglycan/LPS O-acetylase OafA/YrhL